MSKKFHVILTGGVGSRLWPLSRKSRPKQYLQIFKGDALFELAVKRNSEFADGLIVVGNQENQHLSQESLQKLKKENYTNIVEATPRNTAPAIAFAAFAAQPDDILLVTPADHIITQGAAYTKAIERAVELAQQNSIVTFGIKPTKPETGYGYIEYEAEEVKAFREKPDEKTAKSFLESGKFLWNSGMFCFKAEVFLAELQKYAPEVFEKSKKAWSSAENGILDYDASMEIPSISVDYAVMENSEKIKVVASNFEWSDMGSFEAVYDYLSAQGHPVDENGNMSIGTENFTAFVGLENCIFVHTPEADLILAKHASQDVKKIYQKLEDQDSSLIK